MKRTPNASGELSTVRASGDAAPKDPRFSLLVVEGPDAGASYALDAASPTRVLLGTSALCTFRLSDDRISRRHASFRASGGHLVLSDLGSTNGTTVNGVSIREAALAGFEAIRLGRTVISVVRGEATAARLTEETAFGRLLGASLAMRKLYPVLHALAASDAPVLVEGEAGVGKQLAAEEIHAQSRRAARPFVVIECEAAAEESVEPELFSKLESMRGGAIFIDELGALSLSTQRALARFLAVPDREAPRLFFATRRNIDDVARASDELLARLAPARIELPPLRHREGDVELLARAFWSALAAAEPESDPALPRDFVARFADYPWPSNVRELTRAVAVRFAQGSFGSWRSGPRARAGDFLDATVDQELPLGDTKKVVIDELERRYVKHMMARHGNTRDAARAAGVAIRYFQLLRARAEE